MLKSLDSPNTLKTAKEPLVLKIGLQIVPLKEDQYQIILYDLKDVGCSKRSSKSDKIVIIYVDKAFYQPPLSFFMQWF